MKMKTMNPTQASVNVERRELLAVHWGPTAVTPKNRVQLPPDALEVAPLRAVCRALVLEGDCDSQNDYLRILNIASHSEACPTLVRFFKEPIGNKRRNAAGVTLRRAWMQFAEDVGPLALDFADRWLFNNEDGAMFITFMAASDALNVDINRIEAERAAENTWQVYYIKSSNNKRRKQMRTITKDWANLDDKRLMREAGVWVKWHHIQHDLGPVLNEMCKNPNTNLPDWDEGTRNQWIRRLKSFDEAIGRDRHPGPTC